jgi:hypothetical protein
VTVTSFDQPFVVGDARASAFVLIERRGQTQQAQDRGDPAPLGVKAARRRDHTGTTPGWHLAAPTALAHSMVEPKPHVS